MLRGGLDCSYQVEGVAGDFGLSRSKEPEEKSADLQRISD